MADGPQDGPQLELRQASPDDRGDIARIFAATVLLGAPVTLGARAMARYQALCLDWYAAADPADGGGIVALEDGVVRGYLLYCLDQAVFDRWQRTAALRWAAGELAATVAGRRGRDDRRFLRLRLTDGLSALRSAPRPPFPAHAHFNLDPQVRGRSTGHRLAAAMDERVAARGYAGWFGEMNLPVGFPTVALERAGAVLGHQQRNHTLSVLTGLDVRRTTVLRPLAGRTGAFRVRATGASPAGAVA